MYESIAGVQRQLNLNAASVHSNLGNGPFEFLMLTATPDAYLNQSVIVFIAPASPGTTAVVGGRLTGPEINAIEHTYKVLKTAWVSWINTNKALKG